MNPEMDSLFYVTECTDRQMFQFVDWAKKTEVKLFFSFSEEIWTESAFPQNAKDQLKWIKAVLH